MTNHQNKIEKIIAELCPNGVEFKELGDVCVIKTGQSVNKIDIANNPGEFPVINSGREPLGFIGKYNTENDPIGITTRGAGVGSITWCEGKYFRGNLNYSVTIIDHNKISVRFLYYLLLQDQAGIQQLATYQGIPALNKSNLEKLIIPLPPLAIQEEIVKILNSFTELEAELEARKKQYEHYRDDLLDIKDVEYKALGEMGEFIRGNGLQKKDFTEIGVGCIHYGQIYTYYGTFTDKTKSFVSPELAKKLKKAQKGDVIITNTSENLEDVGKAVVWCGEDEIVTGGHATIFKSQKVIGKYFAYYTQTKMFFDQKKKYAKGTKVIDVSATDMKKIKIPVPPLAEQERIVSILDKFDALVNDISIGLPAELSARRQQYEYYRGKLLTFKEYAK